MGFKLKLMKLYEILFVTCYILMQLFSAMFT